MKKNAALKRWYENLCVGIYRKLSGSDYNCFFFFVSKEAIAPMESELIG
jgi:hypothetical protein